MSAFDKNKTGTGSYPALRLRRNRKSVWSRALVRETHLHPSDLIWPLFIIEGKGQQTPVSAMPGVSRFSIDLAIEQIKQARDLGICAVALFPNVDKSLRTSDGAEAFNDKNLICRAVKEIKKQVPDMGIICDVALDPYTDHGHDGLLTGDDVDNDKTIKALVKQALVQADAGCDIIAPSDMMDGRIGAIRASLEDKGHQNVQIMSYAAKYASHLYAPFRDAVGSLSQLKGSKKTYQMDFSNEKEALLEARLDEMEGADMLMVKPGLFYLDIVKELANNSLLPVFAYQVSGEYAMMMKAVEEGLFEFEPLMLESLISFKRAGASGILTYFALEAAKALQHPVN